MWSLEFRVQGFEHGNWNVALEGLKRKGIRFRGQGAGAPWQRGEAARFDLGRDCQQNCSCLLACGGPVLLRHVRSFGFWELGGRDGGDS